MEEIFSFISDCGLARGKMHAEVKVFADRVEKNIVIYAGWQSMLGKMKNMS